jgi:hypothetical protein
MIELTEKDIGKKVIYTGNYGRPPEYGVIISFNDRFVFVRYGTQINSAATFRRNLEWDK